MDRLSRFSVYTSVFLGASALSLGCVNESDHPDAKLAEKAIGIKDNKTTKSLETTRDLQVVKDVKVVDPKTGEVLSETTESTPVKITKEVKERVNVDANVGETKATRSGEATIPVK